MTFVNSLHIDQLHATLAIVLAGAGHCTGAGGRRQRHELVRVRGLRVALGAVVVGDGFAAVRDDQVAEQEMAKLALRRKKTEVEARELDALRLRAVPVERVSPVTALRTARLNVFERGEIVDYNSVYFTGTPNAEKLVERLKSIKV